MRRARTISPCPRAAHFQRVEGPLPNPLPSKSSFLFSSLRTPCPVRTLCPIRFFFVLREIRIRLHFIDLLRVPFAVSCDEQNKLVTIQLSQRAVRDVIAQARRGLQKICRRRAALHEMLDRRVR